MNWESITPRAGQLAAGEFYAYLVVIDPESPAVVLSKVHKGHLGPPFGPLPLPDFAMAHAAASALRFPLGRGAGRPGGEPELTALVEAAKAYAERFEAGKAGVATELPWSVVEATRPSTARFLATGDANDCPSC